MNGEQRFLWSLSWPGCIIPIFTWITEENYVKPQDNWQTGWDSSISLEICHYTSLVLKIKRSWSNTYMSFHCQSASPKIKWAERCRPNVDIHISFITPNHSFTNCFPSVELRAECNTVDWNVYHVSLKSFHKRVSNSSDIGYWSSKTNAVFSKLSL